jgi:hypothetical protein
LHKIYYDYTVPKYLMLTSQVIFSNHETFKFSLQYYIINILDLEIFFSLYVIYKKDYNFMKLLCNSIYMLQLKQKNSKIKIYLC